MLFGDSKTKSRRPKRARDRDKSFFLRVNTSSRDRRMFRLRVFKSLMLLVGVICVALLAKISIQYAGRVLVSDNDLFRIKKYEVKCHGNKIKPEHVIEYASLNSCSNLFALDIRAVHRVLSKVPRIQSVEISRRLNGVLEVEIWERSPMARLFMDGYYLEVDREGYVLGPTTNLHALPAISGHGLVGLKPGVFLGATPLAGALGVLDICESTPIGQIVKVSSIDISDGEMLKLSLADGAVVMLAWQGMGERNESSRENLEHKMVKLADNIREAARRNERILEIDMTVDRNFPARCARR